MDSGEIFRVVGRKQVQGLLEAVQGCVHVPHEHCLGLAGDAGLLEPFEGDDGE